MGTKRTELMYEKKRLTFAVGLFFRAKFHAKSKKTIAVLRALWEFILCQNFVVKITATPLFMRFYGNGPYGIRTRANNRQNPIRLWLFDFSCQISCQICQRLPVLPLPFPFHADKQFSSHDPFSISLLPGFVCQALPYYANMMP